MKKIWLTVPHSPQQAKLKEIYYLKKNEENKPQHKSWSKSNFVNSDDKQSGSNPTLTN